MKQLLGFFLVAALFIGISLPVLAFTSLNSCVQNNICASNLGQLAATQAQFATSGTGAALSVQQTVGIGLTAGTLSYAGLGLWKSAAEQKAAEDEAPYELITDCSDFTLNVTRGGQVTNVSNAGLTYQNPFRQSGEWFQYQTPDGTWNNLLYGQPYVTDVEWICNAGETTETDWDVLEPYFEAVLPGLDLSPFIDVSPLPDPPLAPVIDENTGEVFQPEDLVSPEPEPQPEPTPSPEPTPDALDPDCDPAQSYCADPQYEAASEIEAKQFEPQPHFMVYAQQVFSQKFPFDIFGTLPTTQAGACPVYVFFDQSYELCVIKTFFTGLKVPIIISVLIWAVMAL